MRGLEQYLFDKNWGARGQDVTIQEAQGKGSRNLQSPMAYARDIRPNRLELAKRFLRECL